MYKGVWEMIIQDLIKDIICIEEIEKYKKENKTDYSLRYTEMFKDIVTEIRKNKKLYNFKTIHLDCKNFIYYYMLIQQVEHIIKMCKLDFVIIRMVENE